MEPLVSARSQPRKGEVMFFTIVALALVYGAVVVVRPFITAILAGVILVVLTFPTYRRLREALHGHASRAAFLMLTAITLGLIAPAVILTVLLVHEANVVVARLQSGRAQQIVSRIDLIPYVTAIRMIAPDADLDPKRLLLPVAQQIPRWVAVRGARVIARSAFLTLSFVFVLLSAFYFYVDGEALLEKLIRLSPLPRRYNDGFKTRFKDVVDATFRGQVLTGLAQGAATGIGLAIAGIPGAALWGGVAAVGAMIPLVGAPVVWVPATIYLAVSASIGEGPWWRAVFMLAWGVLVVSVVDNIVRPWVMHGKSQLPTIPLLFAIIGGLQAFGVVGLVIGPLLFSLLKSVVEIYEMSLPLEPVAEGESGSYPVVSLGNRDR